MSINKDSRKYAPATERNREPILEVLKQVLPPNGTVLEVASGTGEHGVFFAPRLNPRQWLPSDRDPQLRASIEDWRAYQPADNLYPPLELDASAPVWPVEAEYSSELAHSFDFDKYPLMAIVNINMIHISPWSSCLGLMSGAGRILPKDGILYLYGPFKQEGKHTSQSNITFDQALRSQNPEWGVRDLDDVVAAAQSQNLTFLQAYQMPANNLSVVFQRQ